MEAKQGHRYAAELVRRATGRVELAREFGSYAEAFDYARRAYDATGPKSVMTNYPHILDRSAQWHCRDKRFIVRVRIIARGSVSPPRQESGSPPETGN